MRDDDNLYPPAGWLDGRFAPMGLAFSVLTGGEAMRLWRERRELSAEALSRLAGLKSALATGPDRMIILEATLLLGRPDLLPAHRLLARGIRARARLRARHFAGAVDDLTQVLERTPRDHASLTNRGAALVEWRRFAEALPDLDRAIALHDSADNRIWRAEAKIALGDRVDARADLRRACALEPGNSVALRRRADLSTGQYGEDPAIDLAELSAAIAGLPATEDLSDLRRRKASILARLGRRAAAISELDTALAGPAGDIGHRHVLIQRAELKLEAGDEAGALADYDAALDDGQGEVSTEFARIELLVRMGRPQAAMLRADAVVQRDNRWSAARYERARLARRLGLLDQAEADLKGCMDAWSYDQAAVLEYADLLESRGDLGAAATLLASHPASHYSLDIVHRLAALYRALGRPALGVASLDRLIEIKPWDVAGLRLRADLKGDLGQTGGAVVDRAAADALALRALANEAGY